MVDTHAHLALCEQPGERLVAAAREVGVRRILTVGLDSESNRQAIADAREHEGVLACVGRHPNSASGFDQEAAADIEQLAADPRVVAVGETGLDYYRDRAPREDQRRAFEAQLEIARRVGKPAVIHVRNGDGPGADAVADAFELLESHAGGATVVLHCFSAPAERVSQAAEHGWFCSFAGNLTYPKAEALRDAAALVPDELLLVETDSPFLAPQPVRGERNQPAHVVHTAARLAEVRGVSSEELGPLVDANAARAFGW